MASKIYTTEQTGKRWKGLQAFGCSGSLVGIAMVIAGTTVVRRPDGHGPANLVLSTLAIIGVLVFLGGVSVHSFGRLGGWWHHG